MRSSPAAAAVLALAAGCQTRLCRDPGVWTPYEAIAVRVDRPPTIDGDLADPAWGDAPWTREFLRSNAFAAAGQRTRAKLAWDDAHLYVAFEVDDADVRTPYTADDQPLYESEVVEIFLDANDDGASYDEIELSPADKLFDARFRARRAGMDLAWASGARHAVKLDATLNAPGDIDRGWTAELAIPLAALSAVPRLPPAPGDRWRFNLFRLDHGRGIEGQAVSPVMVGDFHNLPKFGHLRFATR